MEIGISDLEAIEKIGEDFVNKEFRGHDEFGTFLTKSRGRLRGALTGGE